MVTTPLFVGIPGGPELLIILALVVLLFGADRLPKLARASGEAMGEFSRGRTEIETRLTGGDEAVDADAETETETERTSLTG